MDTTSINANIAIIKNRGYNLNIPLHKGYRKKFS